MKEEDKSRELEAQQYLLKNFFAGNFHEDWDCDAESDKGVITADARTKSAGDLRTLAGAILDYSRSFTNDSELEKKLFIDLGCYYLPSADGLTAKAWLEHVATQLLDIAIDKMQ